MSNSSSAPTTVTRILRDANFQAGFRDARAGRAFAIDDHQEHGDKWAYERGWQFARRFPSVRRLDAKAVALLAGHTASCPGAGAGRKTQLGCPTIARILRDQLAMGGKGAAYPEPSWFLFLRPVEPSGTRPTVQSGGLMTRDKLNALTGLRFIAAAMIVAHHSRGFFQIPLPHYALDHAVSFFFVLSGFILAYAYPKLDNKLEIFDFYAARIARIWPAHLAALLLLLALLQMPLDRTFVANALLLHSWVPSQPWYFSYNPVSWSISTELFFYIAFPILIFQWKRSWWWKWLGSALLVILLMWLVRAMHLPVESQTDELSRHGLLYVSPLARLFEFVTGMVAYLAFQQIQTVARKINHVAFTFLESATIIIAGYSIVSYAIPMFLMEYLPVTGMQWLWSTSDVLIFPLVVIVFAFGRGGLSHLLGSSPMILLGEISFSIYLVHGTIFWFYWKHAQTDAAPDYWGLAICVAATLALAFMIWAFIEMPSRNAAKRWLKKASTSFVQAEACILR